MLTYMATYRSTDKKPCDNIPKEPTISQLADNAISNAFGGGMAKDALNELVEGAQAFKEASSFLDNSAIKAVRRMNNFASAATGATRLATAGNAAARAATTAFMVEPLGLGKVLCPSAG